MLRFVLPKIASSECPPWAVRSSALFSSGESASVSSNPTALRNSCFNHRGSRRAQFQQKIPRTFRSLPVTGRVPQRLKPAVENQSAYIFFLATHFKNQFYLWPEKRAMLPMTHQSHITLPTGETELKRVSAT